MAKLQIAKWSLHVHFPLPDYPSEDFTIAHYQSRLSIADVFAIADYRLSIVHLMALQTSHVEERRVR